MKRNKIPAAILLVLALLAAGLGWTVSFAARDAEPILISQPEEAKQTVRNLLEAARTGDFSGAAACMVPGTDLGEAREPETQVGKLLFQAFQASFTYKIMGDCYASDAGVSLDVTVSYLDFDSVISSLGDRASRLLSRRIGQAESMEEIYDDNNEYREDLIGEVLNQAMAQALEEDARQVTESITVRLAFEAERWRVVPDGDVLRVISGGTAG